MTGFLDDLGKGLATPAPQDDPDVRIYNDQRELGALTKKEEELYARLGRQVYSEGGAEQYPDMAAQLRTLALNRQTIQQRLEAAQAEKEAKERAALEAAQAEDAARQKAEAVLTCPSCGNRNPDGTRFCQECGTKLGAVTRCPGCGAELKPGVRFCGVCGSKVAE